MSVIKYTVCEYTACDHLLFLGFSFQNTRVNDLRFSRELDNFHVLSREEQGS